jgi:formamidopyrimidine-DNA glycosylase
MPELPEVETVRTGLAPFIEGRTIAKMHLARPDLRFPFPENFAHRMSGAKLVQFARRGKYLLAHMNKDGAAFYWLSHLGMSGRYIHTQYGGASVEPGDYAHEVSAPVAAKHIHVRIRFDDGSELAYADPRRFGFMDLIDGAPENSPFLAEMGPEPLGNGFHEAALLAACQGRKTPIKNLLLDQRAVAGLGNIYVCEALFMAGISPRRQAANVGAKRIARLVPAIRDVLGRAIQAGGSSLRDFADKDGKLGYFQHAFLVYDQEGAQCSTPHCHAKIKRIVQSGRSSFYCPHCQK